MHPNKWHLSYFYLYRYSFANFCSRQLFLLKQKLLNIKMKNNSQNFQKPTPLHSSAHLTHSPTRSYTCDHIGTTGGTTLLPLSQCPLCKEQLVFHFFLFFLCLLNTPFNGSDYHNDEDIPPSDTIPVANPIGISGLNTPLHKICTLVYFD